MNAIRRATWPLPPWHALAMLGGVTVLAFLYSLPHMSGWPPDWPAVSMGFHESLMFAGPWAAALAAVASSRWSGAGTLLCPPNATRSGLRWAGREFAVLCGWAAAGLWLGMAPVMYYSSVHGTYGGPDWLVLLGGAPTLCAFAGLGYLLGCALDRTGAVLASAVLAVVIALAGPHVGEHWLPVLPVWDWDAARLGYYENPVMSLFRMAFFTLVAVTLLFAGARWVARRSTAVDRRAAHSLILLAVPVVVVALAGARPVHSIIRDPDPPGVCDSVGTVEVCVHAGHAALLPDVEEIVADVYGAFGTSKFHQAVWDNAAHPRDAQAVFYVPRHYPVDGSEWRASVAADIGWALSGSDGCGIPPAVSGGPGYQQLPDLGIWVSHALAVWIQEEAGYAPLWLSERADDHDPESPLARLRAASPSDIRRWIATHEDKIHACAATLADLP